ncbi:hypothetical protein BTO06_03905 [Tenacibaculum sp. SZ-18]|uniref:hypothetical protein n=1 Tax=Tenacibaculum sp. SZ-18 TaxID=754423 RepID=UPI000C2D2F03|nr:hypothetical protein [Tenacibaculum sp. SZ-18]AUC14336.1 hypothetical protein BTO06_03905 [Tenacibaculum sp. SZ-18]
MKNLLKKFGLVLAVLFLSLGFNSCTDDSKELEQLHSTQILNENISTIEPHKDCPENDRNCNGVPDDEE